MAEPINVSISQMKVGEKSSRLICLGLGSCVAVALWDPSTKMGGLAHVMLPNSATARKKGRQQHPGKYADTAVKTLLEEMKRRGANKFRIIAKIAGGAHMFKMINPTMGDIGKQNIQAIKEELDKEHIKLVAEDVGGNSGRSIELNTNTGKLIIRSIHGASVIL